MIRALWLYVGFLIILGSCTQRTVCPAYQSAFIYDKEEMRKKFSYFQADSTPKVYTASKNKYLVAEPVSYQRKVRSLQTVDAKPIYVNVPDSISGKNASQVTQEELDRAARSVIDSTFIADIPRQDTATASEPLDSIYVITKDKELRLLKYNMPDSMKFDPVTQRYIPEKPSYYVKEVRYNLDQDHYMWYMRHNLILPDVKIARMQNQQRKEAEARANRGLKAFFKNLFKRKPKDPTISDSTQTETDPLETDFDYIDEDSIQAQVIQDQQVQFADPAQPKKKGLFKKKDKSKTKPEKSEAKIEEKKEDDDDGF